MSDKYYLHDCNSYVHSCQQSYRVECRDTDHKIDAYEDEKQKKPKARRWWQKLVLSDPEQATT